MIVPSGEIAFLSNVPITNSYEHTIDFKNANEQHAFWRSFVKIELDNYSYIRREREYLSVGVDIAELDNVNYMYFRARDNDRLYYAFVIDKVYDNNGTTKVFYQIDVMQSFMFDYQFKASYIQQSHVDRWEEPGKPRYSLTEEGLDYGTDYKVESAYKIEQDPGIRWVLVTMSDYSSVLGAGYSTNTSEVYPVPSSFVSFLVPFSTKPIGPTITVKCEGGFIGYTTIAQQVKTNYKLLIRGMLGGGLGEYIKSIALLSYNPFVDEYLADGTVVLNPNATYGIASLKMGGKGVIGNVDGSTQEGDIVADFIVISSAPAEMFNGVLAEAEWTLGLDDSLPITSDWEAIKSAPLTTKRNKKFESKLLCHPYRYNILADWRNDTVIYKNEFIPTQLRVKYSMALSYNAPFRFYIEDYKGDSLGRNNALIQPLAPEMPIISDEYSTYMLQNKNTIQANLTNSIVNASSNVIKGAIGGAMTGGGYGAIGGAIGGVVSGGLDIQAQIRSQNALQQDLKTKPDRIVNSVDSSFNVSDGTDIVSFYRMSITPEAEDILADYFNMFGYTVKRVEVPDLKSRKRFNYIKTISANITGNISQRWLNELKMIFDKGVTLWHYTETDFNYLDYSYENMESKL